MQMRIRLGSLGEVPEAEAVAGKRLSSSKMLRPRSCVGVPTQQPLATHGLAWGGCDEWNELDAACTTSKLTVSRQQAEITDVLLRDIMHWGASGHARRHRWRTRRSTKPMPLLEKWPGAGKGLIGACGRRRLARGDTATALDWANHFAGQMDDAVFPSADLPREDLVITTRTR
jgi:hypothetical protein